MFWHRGLRLRGGHCDLFHACLVETTLLVVAGWRRQRQWCRFIGCWSGSAISRSRRRGRIRRWNLRCSRRFRGGLIGSGRLHRNFFRGHDGIAGHFLIANDAVIDLLLLCSCGRCLALRVGGLLGCRLGRILWCLDHRNAFAVRCATRSRRHGLQPCTVVPYGSTGNQRGRQQAEQKQPRPARAALILFVANFAFTIGVLIVARAGALPRRCLFLEHLVGFFLRRARAPTRRNGRPAQARCGARIIFKDLRRISPRVSRARIGIGRGRTPHRRTCSTICGRFAAIAAGRWRRQPRLRRISGRRVDGTVGRDRRTAIRSRGGAQEGRLATLAAKRRTRRDAARECGTRRYRRLDAWFGARRGLVFGKTEFRARCRRRSWSGGPGRRRGTRRNIEGRRRCRRSHFGFRAFARRLHALFGQALGGSTLRAQLLGQCILHVAFGQTRRWPRGGLSWSGSRWPCRGTRWRARRHGRRPGHRLWCARRSFGRAGRRSLDLRFCSELFGQLGHVLGTYAEALPPVPLVGTRAVGGVLIHLTLIALTSLRRALPRGSEGHLPTHTELHARMRDVLW